MQAAGFNDIALVLSARSLVKRGFLELIAEQDQNGEPYALYRVTDRGFDWLEDNRDELELRRSTVAPAGTSETDLDDLPF